MDGNKEGYRERECKCSGVVGMMGKMTRNLTVFEILQKQYKHIEIEVI